MFGTVMLRAQSPQGKSGLFPQAFGQVSQMAQTVVMQMGCITRGFSDADLERLPFSMDAVEEITHCGWNESQVDYRNSFACS